MSSYFELYQNARKKFEELESVHNADNEAEILVQSLFDRHRGRDCTRFELHESWQAKISDEQSDFFSSWVDRRVKGEPIQWITGRQFFLNHNYQVGQGVLAPRPETEILVQKVLQSFDKNSGDRLTGIEIGIGSGCISIELLLANPKVRILASESSQAALNYAQINLAHLVKAQDRARLETLLVDEGDFTKTVFETASQRMGQVDFIVSNPPYLDWGDEISEEVRANDPEQALFPASRDPMSFYRAISHQAAQVLRPGGRVFFEIASERSDAIAGLFDQDQWKVEVGQDLTGRDRILEAEFLADGAAGEARG